MDISDLLFGLRGRIGRVPYFIMTCASLAFMFWFISANPLAIFLSYNGPQILALLIASVGLLWVQIAMTAKRLHDLGMSGKNTFWMIPLALFGDPSHITSPVVALAAIASIAVQIWLSISPGSASANRFGDAPMLGQQAW